MEHYDVIVIGQGYAGLTAASIAVNRGLRTANFESRCMGGLILNINELYPVPEGAAHSGSELSSDLLMNNMDSGVDSLSEEISAVERGDDDLWLVKTADNTYAARNIIVASGARLRKLGVPGEEELVGQGVSECADCDGPMFRGMETVVVGGGDAAFQEAITLAQYASKVTIVMRGSAPRARAEFLEQAAANPKLVQLTNTRIVSIDGAPGKGVESVRLETEAGGETTLPCMGVFIFVGLEPNTEFLPADLSRDTAGALVTSDRCETALAGLWAIGAVRSGYNGLLTDAAADAGRVFAALS